MMAAGSEGRLAPVGWDALLASDPNATCGHRPELWSALLETLPGLSLRFVASMDAGVLRGGMGLMVERRAGLHWLHALPFLLPGAPLAQAGAHADVDRDIALGIAQLQRELHTVGGEWACYRPGGPAVEDASLALPAGETRMIETGVIDLAQGLDSAYRAIDRKSRQGMQRARESLTVAEESAALSEAYALHLRQGRNWRGHRALPLELSRRLLAAPAAREPVARLFTARDARGLLSAVLVLDAPCESFLWWSGTHPDGRRRQAFTVLLWSVVEWAAVRGRARVNLGASTGLDGVGEFKDTFGARTLRYPVRWLDARYATLPGRAVGRLQQGLRRGRARGVSA